MLKPLSRAPVDGAFGGRGVSPVVVVPSTLIGCSTRSTAPSPALRFSNQKMRPSPVEPPTMSVSPSPSRSTVCELIGQITRTISCSIQSPEIGSAVVSNQEIACFSVVCRSGFCAPLFGATTSGRPSPSRSPANTRM